MEVMEETAVLKGAINFFQILLMVDSLYQNILEVVEDSS